MADYWDALAAGGQLPAGVVLTAGGNPTTDPSDVDTAIHLPLAGAKGYGLAVLVDVLTAALSGGPIGREVTVDAECTFSAFVLAIDPAVFDPSGGVKDAVDRLCEQARSTRPTEPGVPVRLPGDRAESERIRRRAEGIPVVPSLWARMTDAIREEGVQVAEPKPLEATPCT